MKRKAKRKRALPPGLPVEPDYPPIPPGTSPTKASADIPFICARKVRPPRRKVR